ncbi:MAG: hypothetical protein H0W94_01360 [Actinobacteria bacterium]|nr:hypothetical protein [Actinomycetota bacterium]
MDRPIEESLPAIARRSRRVQAAGAFLAYLASSLLLFGLPTLGDPARTMVGFGTDPGVFVWQFAWWPHAISNGMNPFVTDAVWAPVGYNLAHATSLPAATLLAWPITALFGPVVAYNLVALLAPAMSGFCAFLLCRYVSGAFWPSLAGGAVFGFSPYIAGHMLGHPNLTLVFAIPLVVLLVLRVVDGSISAAGFVLRFALVLVVQFLISLEVFATTTLFGWGTLVLAYLLLGAERRRKLVAVGRLAAGAYGVAAAVVSPYLYHFFFAAGAPESPIYDFYPSFYSNDLLNFVVPTAITRFGRGEFAEVAAGFTGNISEQVAYVGLPLILIAVLFARIWWRRPAGKLLLVSLVAAAVASLGPALKIGGTETVPLPWALMRHLPLIGFALPGRTMVFGFLVLAVILALWLSDSHVPARPKWILSSLTLVALLPASSTLWATKVDTPPFFSSGIHRRYLIEGENTLVLPYGSNGNSMLWQAEAGISFRMAEGYLGVVPPERFSAWPIVGDLYSGQLTPGYEEELRKFLGGNDVRTVIVDERAAGPWEQLLAPLGVAPQRVGGVVLYRVPQAVRTAYAAATPTS